MSSAVLGLIVLSYWSTTLCKRNHTKDQEKCQPVGLHRCRVQTVLVLKSRAIFIEKFPYLFYKFAVFINLMYVTIGVDST